MKEKGYTMAQSKNKNKTGAAKLAKIFLKEFIKEFMSGNQLSLDDFSKISGISLSTLKDILYKESTSFEKITEEMEKSFDIEIFLNITKKKRREKREE